MMEKESQSFAFWITGVGTPPLHLHTVNQALKATKAENNFTKTSLMVALHLLPLKLY